MYMEQPTVSFVKVLNTDAIATSSGSGEDCVAPAAPQNRCADYEVMMIGRCMNDSDCIGVAMN